MLNIELCGWTCNVASDMKKSLDKLIKEVELQNDAVSRRPRLQDGQGGGDLFETCDGEAKERPFIRLYSSKVIDILKILSSFQGDPTFHVDVQFLNALTPSGMYYFPAEDIKSGQWRSKFNIKNIISAENINALVAILINIKDIDEKSIIEYFDYQFLRLDLVSKAVILSPNGSSYNEYFERLKKLVEVIVNEGKDFIFCPHEENPHIIRIHVKKYEESMWL